MGFGGARAAGGRPRGSRRSRSSAEARGGSARGRRRRARRRARGRIRRRGGRGRSNAGTESEEYCDEKRQGQPSRHGLEHRPAKPAGTACYLAGSRMPRVLPIDRSCPDADVLAEASRVLRGGGLVAFPTETVYGLGALALDDRALARIFEAKGRPAHHPLIAHVGNEALARALSGLVAGSAASRLARALWPGPAHARRRAGGARAGGGGGRDLIACGACSVAPGGPRAPRGARRAGGGSERGKPVRSVLADHRGARREAARRPRRSRARRRPVRRGDRVDGRRCAEQSRSRSPPRGGADLPRRSVASCPICKSLRMPSRRAPKRVGLRPAWTRAITRRAPPCTWSRRARRRLRWRGRLRPGKGVRWASSCANSLPRRGGWSPTWISLRRRGPSRASCCGSSSSEARDYARHLDGTLHDLDDQGACAVVVQAVPDDDPAWWAVADRLARGSTDPR